MTAPFDPARIISTLAQHHVDYVLIGGLAGSLHWSPAATNDADICPARTPGTLPGSRRRSSNSMLEFAWTPSLMGCPFDRSAQFLDLIELLNTTTVAGDLDISDSPTGTGGFDDLVGRAVEFDIGDACVSVASLDDIIRSKRTADRPKDLATLPLLEALRHELA